MRWSRSVSIGTSRRRRWRTETMWASDMRGQRSPMSWVSKKSTSASSESNSALRAALFPAILSFLFVGHVSGAQDQGFFCRLVDEQNGQVAPGFGPAERHVNIFAFAGAGLYKPELRGVFQDFLDFVGLDGVLDGQLLDDRR